jgi:acyl-CoA oxidase
VGLNAKEAWDTFAGCQLVEAGLAHIHYWVYNNFLQYILPITDESLRSSMGKLCMLFGVTRILEHPTGYYTSGYATGE